MSFFVRRDEHHFEATELTRGPWSPDHQHGGPPSALLVGRLAAQSPERRVTRAVVEFLRPVPIGPLTLELEAPGGGRRVQRARGSLRNASGEIVCSASVLLVDAHPLDPAPPRPVGTPPPPLPEQELKGQFPFFRWDVGYHTAMELRFVRGHFGAGPVTVWMRQRVPLVEGETPTPLERALCVVDSVHGVSWNVDPREMTALNPDLVVALHRFPVGQWVCLDAQTANEPGGIGVAASRLWDAEGSLGWSTQTLILARNSV